MAVHAALLAMTGAIQGTKDVQLGVELRLRVHTGLVHIGVEVDVVHGVHRIEYQPVRGLAKHGAMLEVVTVCREMAPSFNRMIAAVAVTELAEKRPWIPSQRVSRGPVTCLYHDLEAGWSVITRLLSGRQRIGGDRTKANQMAAAYAAAMRIELSIYDAVDG